MSAFNTLTDGYVASPAPAPPPTDMSAAGGIVGPSPGQAGPRISDLQGIRPLSGNHNIPLQVGFLGIVALVVVIGIRLLGFKFSGTASLGVGGR